MHKLKHQRVDLLTWNSHADLLFATSKQAEFECLELLYAFPHQAITIQQGDVVYIVNHIILKMLSRHK